MDNIIVTVDAKRRAEAPKSAQIVADNNDYVITFDIAEGSGFDTTAAMTAVLVTLQGKLPDITFTGGRITVPRLTGADGGQLFVGLSQGDIETTTAAYIRVLPSVYTRAGGRIAPDPANPQPYDAIPAALNVALADEVIVNDVSEGKRVRATLEQILALGGGGGGEKELVFVEYGDETEGLYATLAADLAADKLPVLFTGGHYVAGCYLTAGKLEWTSPWKEGVGVTRYRLSSAGVWSNEPEAGVRLDQGAAYNGNYMSVGLSGMVVPVAPDTSPTEDSSKLITSGGAYAALANKVNTEEGKGLSSNDYTATDKEKVDGIPADPVYLVEITETTSLSTVKAYLAAGQIPYLRYNNNIALLRRSNPSADDIRFEYYDEANGKHIVYNWDDSDKEWLPTEYPIVKGSGHTSGAVLITDQYGYVMDTPRATFLPKYTTLTLAVSDWEAAASGYTCTKAVTGMTATAIVLLTFSDTETDFGYSQAANALTFTAPSIPSEAVTVNVTFQEGVALR